MTEETFHIPSSRYVEALQRNGVDYFVTMLDWVQLALHQQLDKGVDGVRVVYLQFTRMGDEARRLSRWLEQHA